jgi:2-polyprenyl-3-methyl-5-hydroxy-6-metoxy-1,4-benzoquinol methylase
MGELSRRADAFRRTLAEARSRSQGVFDWYPHDTLGNVVAIEQLVGPEVSQLVELAGGEPVLDAGCADGDLAFLLESLGCEVHAIDDPVNNYNAMLGVRALASALASKVRVEAADLDAQFALPSASYGLALVLGLLYHLKNPFYVMERISRHARHCLVSTAITDYVPGLYETVTGTSVTYLADVYEVNRDSTNYWFFSDAGFRRLLSRANWDIVSYYLTGGEGESGPGAIGAKRAFCLARSRYPRDGAVVLLGRGWHEAEQGGWRWTERRFSMRLTSSVVGGTGEIRMDLYVPEAALAGGEQLILRAVANGVSLPEERFGDAGPRAYVRRLPVSTSQADVRIDFTLNRALPPDADDPRERGIIVRAITSCAKR